MYTVRQIPPEVAAEWVWVPPVRETKPCWYCGKEIEVSQLTRDHQIPLSRGGSNAASNVVQCCRSCNSRKGARTVDEYRAWLRARGFGELSA